MIGSVEAEAAFLGCLLQSAPFVTACLLRQAEPGDFTDPRHEAVFTCMQALQARHEPIDAVTVLGELRRSGLQGAMTADREAGVFLAELMEAPPSIGSGGAYLTVLLEHRVRRQVEQTGVRLQQVAGASDMTEMADVVNAEGVELTRAFTRMAARREPQRAAS